MDQLRFLRKKDFSVNEARNLFQESEDWRKDFGEGKEMDPVKAEQVAELYPRYYHGQYRLFFASLRCGHVGVERRG